MVGETSNSVINSLQEARDAFNAFDYQGNGFIPAWDIREALMVVMGKGTEREKKNSVKEDIIKHFKLQHNRKIYFKEFKDMITQRR